MAIEAKDAAARCSVRRYHIDSNGYAICRICAFPGLTPLKLTRKAAMTTWPDRTVAQVVPWEERGQGLLRYHAAEQPHPAGAG
jgi:hypothetical protein